MERDTQTVSQRMRDSEIRLFAHCKKTKISSGYVGQPLEIVSDPENSQDSAVDTLGAGFSLIEGLLHSPGVQGREVADTIVVIEPVADNSISSDSGLPVLATCDSVQEVG